MRLNYREHFTMASSMNDITEQALMPDTQMRGRSKYMSTHGSVDSTQASDYLSDMKEFKLQELTMLSITPILRRIHHWWLQRAEHHFLICADVEEQRAREAQMNVAYYQKRAALARSARH